MYRILPFINRLKAMTVMMTMSNMLTLKKMLLTSTPFGWDQGCGSQVLEGGSGSGKSKVDPDPASGRIQLSTFPGKRLNFM